MRHSELNLWSLLVIFVLLLRQFLALPLQVHHLCLHRPGLDLSLPTTLAWRLLRSAACRRFSSWLVSLASMSTAPVSCTAPDSGPLTLLDLASCLALALAFAFLTQVRPRLADLRGCPIQGACSSGASFSPAMTFQVKPSAGLAHGASTWHGCPHQNRSCTLFLNVKIACTTPVHGGWSMLV